MFLLRLCLEYIPVGLLVSFFQDFSSLHPLLFPQVQKESLLKFADAGLNLFEVVKAHVFAALPDFFVHIPSSDGSCLQVTLLLVVKGHAELEVMLGIDHLGRKFFLQVFDVLVLFEFGFTNIGIEGGLLDAILHEERVSHFGLLAEHSNFEFFSADFPGVKLKAAHLALVLQLHHLHIDLLLLIVTHVFHHAFVLNATPHASPERLI